MLEDSTLSDAPEDIATEIQEKLVLEESQEVLVPQEKFVLSKLVDPISRKFMVTLPRSEEMCKVHKFLFECREKELLKKLNDTLKLIYYYPVKGKNEDNLVVYSRHVMHTLLYEADRNIEIMGKDHTLRPYDAYINLLTLKIMLIQRLGVDDKKLPCDYKPTMSTILEYINIHLEVFEKNFTNIYFSMQKEDEVGLQDDDRQRQNLRDLFKKLRLLQAHREYSIYHEFNHLHWDGLIPPRAILPAAAGPSTTPPHTPPRSQRSTGIQHYGTPGQTPQKSSPDTEKAAKCIRDKEGVVEIKGKSKAKPKPKAISFSSVLSTATTTIQGGSDSENDSPLRGKQLSWQ